MSGSKKTDLGALLQQLGGRHQERRLELELHSGQADTLAKFKALGSEPRLRILEHLKYPNRLSNLTEIAHALDMHLATVTMHVNILEGAGLVLCEHVPGERGTQRVCGCFIDWLSLHMTPPLPPASGLIEQAIPIGSYTTFEVTPTCGLFGEEGQIGRYDDPVSFYEAERIYSQLLWFTSGFVEYLVPHRLPQGAGCRKSQAKYGTLFRSPHLPRRLGL